MLLEPHYREPHGYTHAGHTQPPHTQQPSSRSASASCEGLVPMGHLSSEIGSALHSVLSQRQRGLKRVGFSLSDQSEGALAAPVSPSAGVKNTAVASARSRAASCIASPSNLMHVLAAINSHVVDRTPAPVQHDDGGSGKGFGSDSAGGHIKGIYEACVLPDAAAAAIVSSDADAPAATTAHISAANALGELAAEPPAAPRDGSSSGSSSSDAPPRLKSRKDILRSLMLSRKLQLVSSDPEDLLCPRTASFGEWLQCGDVVVGGVALACPADATGRTVSCPVVGQSLEEWLMDAAGLSADQRNSPRAASAPVPLTAGAGASAGQPATTVLYASLPSDGAPSSSGAKWEPAVSAGGLWGQR